jgi:integrase
MPDVRDKGEGTIYLRADSLRWTAAVTMHDGKRPTLGCSHRHRPNDRRPCPESRANLTELVRLRDVRAPSDGHRLTVGQYLQRWLEDVRPNLAPATWRKHESIVRVHINPNIGPVRLSELSVADCRQLFDRLAGSLDGQSVRHVRATLRRGLADALRDGLITRNVSALAEAAPLKTAERQYLDAPQCRLLIEGTRDDPLHAFWVLAVTTGMREAEMLGLTWESVDLDAATATVSATLQRVEGQWQLRSPKTAKSRRTVPLPAVTVAALRQHRTRQLEQRAAAGKLGPDGLVFTSVTGRPIHGSNLLPELRAHLDRLGLPRVTIHDLRHSCATVLYAMGVPLPAIADILGHSSIRVTADLYRHRVPELARDAAERMQGAVG